MRQMPIADLVLDFDFYPRSSVDKQHVHYMAEAISAGAELPPVIIDRKSKRVVDGFHRVRAYARLKGPKCKIEVVEKTYRDERQLFLDAMRYNANHGRMLSTYDRVHCLLRCDRLNIRTDDVASALNLTASAIETLRKERVGKLVGIRKKNGAPMPLKRTIGHMKGKVLSKEQWEANEQLGGMQQLFYVNQLLMLIDSDLLDKENEALMERLALLGKKISELSGALAAS